jgi:hypothetical protein
MLIFNIFILNYHLFGGSTHKIDHWPDDLVAHRHHLLAGLLDQLER